MLKYFSNIKNITNYSDIFSFIKELYGQVAEVQQLIAGHVKIMHEAKENIESLKKNIKDVKVYSYLESARRCSVIILGQHACISNI